MNIDFFDPYPHRQFEPTLRSLLADATKIDAAIAFVTRGGAAAFRDFLAAAPSPPARLVASVRFPTDLPELAAEVKILSKNRAEAVKKALVEKYKFDENRLSIKGVGWDVPADAKDPLNQDRNRRVEVRVYPAEQ